MKKERKGKEENIHDKKGENWLHGNSCVLMDRAHGTTRESSDCIDNSHYGFLQRVAKNSLGEGTHLHSPQFKFYTGYLRAVEVDAHGDGNILRNSFTAANPSPLYPPEMGSSPKGGERVGEGEQSVAPQSYCISPVRTLHYHNIKSWISTEMLLTGNVICKYNRDCCEIIIYFVIDQREVCILLENSIHKDLIYGKEPATGGMGGKIGDEKNGEEKNGEEKNGEEKNGEEKNGERKNGEGKNGEGKNGNVKNGEG
ncbi:AP-3 complex subunit beta, putative [Plasmodium ovale curtisi]|uniref:AP-3 complex subunit beta, putative n=1 Tax=Plasmodium ovale curtisi TaxID=864141 RepID=A0A1A8WMJ2_PLAOA|nr:AP-3 complex subunit beta, putative [Plasmodium ovale curtisi]